VQHWSVGSQLINKHVIMCGAEKHHWHEHSAWLFYGFEAVSLFYFNIDITGRVTKCGNAEDWDHTLLVWDEIEKDGTSL
jgi:hypothetical protein